MKKTLDSIGVLDMRSNITATCCRILLASHDADVIRWSRREESRLRSVRNPAFFQKYNLENYRKKLNDGFPTCPLSPIAFLNFLIDRWNWA
jgi:hypothetical protein